MTIKSMIRQGNKELHFDVDETPEGVLVTSRAYYVDGNRVANPTPEEISTLREQAIKEVANVYFPNHKSHSSKDENSGWN